MVEHRPQRVGGARVLRGLLDGFRDGHAERAGGVGEPLAQRPAHLGLVGRARRDGGAEGLHQDAAVRLALVGVADLPHLAGLAEDLRGERERRSPLAGPGLGGEPHAALLGVVVRLRHRRVGLVRADGALALVLVVDPRGGAEGGLEATRAVQRAGTPQAVDLAHLLGDLDPPLGGRLLRDEPHREERGQVVGDQRLLRARVQRRRRGRREVGDDVVPVRRDVVLVEEHLRGFSHGKTLGRGRTPRRASRGASNRGVLRASRAAGRTPPAR